MKCTGRNLSCIAAVLLTLLVRQGFADHDLTGDGVISTDDIRMFFEKVAGGTPPSGANFDLDRDGVVDIKDVLLYGQWVNGLHTSPSHPSLYMRNPADTAAFQEYLVNLKARKGIWTPNDLKQRYPDSTGKQPLSYPAESVGYIQRLDTMLMREARLSSAQAARFSQTVLTNGMAVHDSLRYPNFYTAFDAIHGADMPIMVTTDAILHTIYQSYDNILTAIETNRFVPLLDSILMKTYRYSFLAYDTGNHVTDTRDYLAVALLLLQPSRTDITKSSAVTGMLNQISGERMESAALFGRDRMIDFSQFKPRGHYTKSAQLSQYFKAMMWLSRADLSFELTGESSSERMQKAAVVLWDCVVNSGAYGAWLELYEVTEFMVGTSDGLSVKGMSGQASKLGIRSGREYLKTHDSATFVSKLCETDYGIQMILSAGKLYGGPQDSLDLPRIFSFMPQRFILDSYTFSQLVFPLAGLRTLPSSLDLAFAIGDNSALNDHRDLTTTIAGTLGSQRELYDRLSPGGWQSNMYTLWLNFLRSLNGVEMNMKVSPVFRTDRWRSKMRTTQLMSWAHLRHNTILYAKQSYTGMIICEHPAACVEPYPDFFRNVSVYAKKAESYFSGYNAAIASFFTGVATINEKLEAAAKLVAQGKLPSPEQQLWLKSIVVPKWQSVGCGNVKVLDGWYFDLIYDSDNNSKPGPGQTEAFSTIADVHTKPADELGPATVLHAATGPVNLMAVVIEHDSCKTVFVGPVGSYYDVVTTGDSPVRLTNEQWAEAIKNRSAYFTRPSWAGKYVTGTEEP